jgi:4-oxalocrotonate tautomerase
MPLIQVTMLKGRTIEQKRKLAARITDAMVEDAKAAKEAVVVTFIEITREDYASAGVLLADKNSRALFTTCSC